MGSYTNRRFTGIILWGIGIIVILMNIYLLVMANIYRFVFVKAFTEIGGIFCYV